MKVIKVNRLDAVIRFFVADCVKRLQEVLCSKDRYMVFRRNNHSILKAHTVVIILFVGVIASVQGLGAAFYTQEDVVYQVNGMGNPGDVPPLS